MRRILDDSIYSITLASLAALSIMTAACDDIDEDDRIVSGPTETHIVAPDTLTITYSGETFTCIDEHRLLIEDFTGWNCVNCPDMADYLTSQITSTYPSTLVSLHMTGNSFSAKHPNGYNCASADSIANWIGGSTIATQLGLPVVCIDNVTYSGNTFNSNTDALSLLAFNRIYDCNIAKTEPQANIGISITGTGNDTYSISTLVSYPGHTRCNLKLWLIEDGLVSYIQNSKSGYITNYTNHGILRQVINGSYEGQGVQLDSDGMALVHTTLHTAGTTYVPGNCSVVAIVCDEGDVTVINCAQQRLE